MNDAKAINAETSRQIYEELGLPPRDRIPDFNDFMDGFVGSMEQRAEIAMRGTVKTEPLTELSMAAMEYGETLGANPFDFAASQAAFKRLQDAAAQWAGSKHE